VAISARPVSTRGAYRDRHERETGCGGRGSVGAEGGRGAGQLVSGSRRAGRTALKRTAKPCGSGTRGWCQAAGGEFDPTGSIRHQAGSDGGKRNSSPGRARHKPSNHCAGNAGMLRLYLYARVRISLHLAHETAGAASTRHSLLPLVGRERLLSKPRVLSAPRERRHTFNCHRPA
jgi:hypothetical protein